MLTKSKAADLNLLKIDIHDLVKQICLTDMELFKTISIEEINSFEWTKANKKTKCPNLMMSTKQFNKINLWVQNEILNTTKEVRVLSKFIKLSKYLLKYNNFQSAYAIKSALDSTPIHRLEQLWSRINKKHWNTWQKLSSVFSVESNYHNLRLAIAERKPPLIPFLGVYLCDLTGLDAAYPKVKGEETEIRRSSMNKIYDEILHYQNFRYEFKSHRGVQEYIQSMEYMEEFEAFMLDTYFNMSKELEPEPSQDISNSSSTNVQNIPQIEMTNSTDYSPDLKKRISPDINERGSYRVIPEEQRRKVSPLNMPDSPTLIHDKNCNSLSPDWLDIPSKNLLDDSELLPHNGNTHVHKSLQHSSSMTSQANNSLFGFSPTINLYNNNSFRKSEIETKSYIQYNDPDILTTNQILKPVLSGLVKRKVKSKGTICINGYQKVLARLFMNQLQCCLNFYLPKISKPKVPEDFREDYHVSISLIDTEVNFESLIISPKIYIHLPYEVYVVQSIEEDEVAWPSLHDWWALITESINTVSASKAAVSEPQCNLINLDDEFTRL